MKVGCRRRGNSLAWAIGLAAGMCICGGQAASAEEAASLLDRAAWIWWDKDTNAIEPPYHDSEFSFTKEFTVDGEVKKAALHVTAESVCKLSINDKLVGEDDNWQTLETYDIKPFLVPGKNRLLVRARTKTWFAGLFVAGTVEQGNGSTLTILSDGTWDCASNVDHKIRKAEVVVRGLQGGWWNNCHRLMEMPELWYRPNTELVAPGIAWAKPWGGARVKVLAIQPRVTQRDTVELMHRTEMDVTVVFSDFFEREDERVPFFPNTRGWRKRDVAAELAKALEGTFDVILLGSIDPGLFYEVAAQRLKAMVRNGTGLIYTSLPGRRVEKPGQQQPSWDPAYEKELTAAPVADPPFSLITGVPFAALPGFRIGPEDKSKDFRKVAALFQFGKGRVMRLNLAEGWGLLANAPDPNDLHYEYYQSFAVKSVLWAAGKEPVVGFMGFPPGLAIDRADRKGELTFALSGGQGKCELSLAVRSPEKLFSLPATPVAQPGVHQGQGILCPVYEAKTSAQAGQAVSFALPPLPAGHYFADVQAVAAGKKVNWATAALTVNPRLRINQLTLAPPWIDVAEGKPAQLEATAVLTEAAPDGASVAFTLVDNYDRLLAVRSVGIAKGADRAKTVFAIKGFATTLGKVRAELLVGRDKVALAVARFTAVRRDWDRFGFFGWIAAPRDHASNLYARVLANLGLDAGRGMVVSHDTLEAFDTVALPGYSGMPRNAFDITPESIKGTQEITRRLKEQLPFDPMAYFCGDEIDYGGGDELPGRIVEFRKFLRVRYGTIAALDKQWDTRYASFEEIYPLTTRERLEDREKGKLVREKDYIEQAKATGNYSRWMDQWLSNYKAFNDMARVPRMVIKQFDPHARVGVDCPMWPFSRCGHDWYTFLKEFEMFSPYGKEGEVQPMEEARSFARPGTMLGLEYGGYIYNAFVRREELTDGEWQHWRVWSGLLRGFTNTWWYQLTPPGNECSISPGLLPYPTLRQYARDLAAIRGGYYTLYSRARRDYGKIALHDSVPSRLLCPWVPDFGSEQAFTLHYLLRLMQDYAGYQYTLVSDEQIVRGGLKDYAALVMPSSLAVGQAEAAALKKFVEGGGILVADVRPGLADESGRIGHNDTIRQLFGLAWKKDLGRKMLTAELSGRYKGVAFRNPLQKFPADPALELRGAKPLLQVDGIPLVTCHDVGAGSAICLNVPFNYYRGYPTMDHMYVYLGDPDYHGMLGRILDAIFRAHHVERPVQVTVPQEPWLAGLDTPLHVDGAAQYISLTKRRMAKEETAATVSFRARRGGHCYDMLEGKYLGEGQEWQAEIAPGGVRLFAVLPYKVGALDLHIDKQRLRPGEEVSGDLRIETSSRPPERHVIHVEVVRPDGQEVRYLARNVETRQGKAAFALPLALNEPPGRYTLRSTDVATRILATAPIEVQP